MYRPLPILTIALAIVLLPSLLMAEEAKRPPMARPGPEGFFKRLDANNDGQITLDEMPGPMKEHFGRLLERVDKNGDKKISLDELKLSQLKASRKSLGAPGRHRPDGPKVGNREHHEGHPGRDRDAKAAPAHVWWSANKGKPGMAKLARRGSEAPGMKGKGKKPNPEQIFKRLDKDGNNQLSLDEFKQGMQKLHAQMKKHCGGPDHAMLGPGKGGHGKKGPGMKGPGKGHPKALAMRGPGQRGHGKEGFGMKGPGKGHPKALAMRGPGQRGHGKKGPGMRGPNREALYHLAQYHLAMYQLEGGKLQPGMRGLGVHGKHGPGTRGPGRPAMGPGKGYPKALAMRGGPGTRGPGMKSPGGHPWMKPAKRPGMGGSGMKGPGKGSPQRPNVAIVGRIMMGANKVFDKIDANKDGKVDAKEAAVAHKECFVRILKKVDKDDDKAISKQEAKVALVSMVKRFHAARAGGMKGPGMHHGMKGKKAGKKPGKIDREKIKAVMAARFKKVDKDGNGTLGRDEVPESMKERFSKIDTDADGQLTEKELKAAFAAHHKDAAKKGCPKAKKKD
ncbi:MAG: EF-hand domain-containing protein [Pirellulales bacterium]|nr:EF-hand domain-containing protein [Pirellulales bacterium]